MLIDGQKRISEIFEQFTVSTLPHSSILVGEDGCGKHLLCEKISEKLNLPSEKMDKNNCTFEYMSEIVQRPFRQIYVIDLDGFDDKKQNVLLKFIEEPNIYTHIFLLTDSLNNVIDTIQGRCQIFQFEKYSAESLKKFSEDENALIYFTTPGQLKNYSEKLPEVISLCENINKNIAGASVGNILVISDKLKLNKDEKEKIPVELFMKVLLNFQRDDYESYRLILQGGKDLKLNIDKRSYIDNMLIKLKFLKKNYYGT